MTDQDERSSSSSSQNSVVEPVASAECDRNDTITALVNANPLRDSSANETVKDASPPPTRRRSSVSILQALVNTSHLLTTNDARKR